ncbi:Uma2 family endonuclease [Panacagrimonas sp.]|uniref:Uma2 family endonuclease n=1 Tax=Panacagrimonas sp. TaxID=2480088 RepID=UPI003B52C3E6
MRPARLPLLSAHEYLDGELRSELRHEYVAGQVFAIAGAGRRHGEIVVNLGSALHRAARGGACRVYVADMKVRIDAADIFYYPDILVGCDPADDHEYYSRAPCLLVEVLSDSTERADRGEKWQNYRLLPSLREYLLVDSRRIAVEVYRLGDGGWTCEPLNPEEAFDSTCLGCSVPLQEIYAGLRFDDRA